MADSYPYTLSNGKIAPILARVRTAAKPQKFNRDLLTKWGFGASNDRAMINILKGMGFLTEGGAPTELYDRLRHPQDWRVVLAERIKSLYSEIYAIDGEIHAADEDEIRGAISRVTGKDEESVKRYFATFKALAALASFKPKDPPKKEKEEEKGDQEDNGTNGKEKEAAPLAGETQRTFKQTEYHYNIQIHLPVTTDISVYNAIFKSLRDNLGV